jgi:hypothetical protein
MFTHDKGVVETVAALCGWVAIVVVGDGLNAVYSGQHQLACATVPQAWRRHALWCCNSVPLCKPGRVSTQDTDESCFLAVSCSTENLRQVISGNSLTSQQRFG